MGFTPDIILGDFDSVSARAMEIGAEHVHHVHPDGRNPGYEELQAFGKRLCRDADLRRRMGAVSTEIVRRHTLDATLDTFEDLYRTVQGMAGRAGSAAA